MNNWTRNKTSRNNEQIFITPHCSVLLPTKHKTADLCLTVSKNQLTIKCVLLCMLLIKVLLCHTLTKSDSMCSCSHTEQKQKRNRIEFNIQHTECWMSVLNNWTRLETTSTVYSGWQSKQVTAIYIYIEFRWNRIDWCKKKITFCEFNQ